MPRHCTIQCNVVRLAIKRAAVDWRRRPISRRARERLSVSLAEHRDRFHIRPDILDHWPNVPREYWSYINGLLGT